MTKDMREVLLEGSKRLDELKEKEEEEKNKNIREKKAIKNSLNTYIRVNTEKLVVEILNGFINYRFSFPDQDVLYITYLITKIDNRGELNDLKYALEKIKEPNCFDDMNKNLLYSLINYVNLKDIASISINYNNYLVDLKVLNEYYKEFKINSNHSTDMLTMDKIALDYLLNETKESEKRLELKRKSK